MLFYSGKKMLSVKKKNVSKISLNVKLSELYFRGIIHDFMITNYDIIN